MYDSRTGMHTYSVGVLQVNYGQVCFIPWFCWVYERFPSKKTNLDNIINECVIDTDSDSASVAAKIMLT